MAVRRRRSTALPNKTKAEHPPTPPDSDESNVVVHQMRMSPQGAAIRERMAAARERKAQIIAEREAEKKAETERRRGATQRLHNAFGDVLSRKVEHVDTAWAIDRYAELGLAACMVDDLGTIRGVLSDLMKHAKDQPQVSEDERDLLATAVAQLGPEAVALAASKAGMRVLGPGEGTPEHLAALDEYDRLGRELDQVYEPEDEPPLTPGRAALLGALAKE